MGWFLVSEWCVWQITNKKKWIRKALLGIWLYWYTLILHCFYLIMVLLSIFEGQFSWVSTSNSNLIPNPFFWQVCMYFKSPVLVRITKWFVLISSIVNMLFEKIWREDFKSNAGFRCFRFIVRCLNKFVEKYSSFIELLRWSANNVLKCSCKVWAGHSSHALTVCLYMYTHLNPQGAWHLKRTNEGKKDWLFEFV